MIDFLRATLAHRGTVADDVLLDCLILAAELETLHPDIVPQPITLKELRRAWWCHSNNEVIQRMAALQVTQLVDTTYHSGRNAYWEVHRVGPA